MPEKSVAIIVITYRNPGYLAGLLENMRSAGWPDVPTYVFQDPSPFDDRAEVNAAYLDVINRFPEVTQFYTAVEWSCMQGITEHAFRMTDEDWLIWVPDDVHFTPGSLWNEYGGVLTYGRDWVGGIQAPYWNAHDLVAMGVMKSKEQMLHGWQPASIPRNPFWETGGMPRAYVNLNGAGFSLSRKLWSAMGGFPKVTWRLDEYAGYQGWKHGMPIITLPGTPRVHYFGGSTDKLPEGYGFHTEEAWIAALGKPVAEATGEIYSVMHRLKYGGMWNEMVKFFNEGGRLV